MIYIKVMILCFVSIPDNLSNMKLADLEVDAEFVKLVEKEVKGCGDIYAIAVDLKVSYETAHRLKHFKSLESVLEMSHPDLKVIDFAEVLFRSKRVAAVKHIDKMLRKKSLERSLMSRRYLSTGSTQAQGSL